MYRYSIKLLNQARRHLAAGGVIAYPTESCYGLGCDPLQPKAIARILNLKGRSKAKGLIVIAAAETQLKNLIQPLSLKDKKEMSQYWPGPFSLILPSTTKVPSNLIGKQTKVAVRVTKHQLVQQLCRSLGLALVSTSANRTGHKPCRNYREAMRQFGKQVLVLPGLTNFAKNPSTVIDWTTKTRLR
jgi:L-threonylcarbamoyladenylate synthase